MIAIHRPERKLRNGLRISHLKVEATSEHCAGRRVWELSEDFEFQVSRIARDGELDLWIRIKKGFKTDFASIPWLFWVFFPADECAEAAVIHDWLYQATDLDRHFCDSVFRLLMKLTNKPYPMRVAHYLGVRIGGWAARKPRKDDER